MLYTLDSGKVINIPDNFLDNAIQKLEISQKEAIQLYLEDNDFIENVEVETLTKKAKSAKVLPGAKKAGQRKTATREKKPDIEKEQLIELLTEALTEKGYSVEILNKSKLISFTIGDNVYKLDLIKQRKK